MNERWTSHNALVHVSYVLAVFCCPLLQPSPSTSSLSSNHSASPNVTSSAPSSARGETGTHFTTLFAVLADIPPQGDSLHVRGRQRFSRTHRTCGLNLWHLSDTMFLSNRGSAGERKAIANLGALQASSAECECRTHPLSALLSRCVQMCQPCFCLIHIIKSEDIRRRLWKLMHSPLAGCWQRGSGLVKVASVFP